MYGQEGQNISVTAPVSRALERVNKILLDPFDLSKWFLIGFGAWLATLGRGGGGGGNFHVPSGSGGPGNMDQAIREILPHLPIIIIGTVGVLLLAFGIKVLLLWLNSRGDFIFVHCIVLNKGLVKEPWTQFREQGNSLFLFRLAINVVILIFVLIFLGIGIGIFLLVYQGGANEPPIAILAALSTLIIAIPVFIGFGIALKFIKDFAVPIMYLRQSTCTQAWHELKGLLKANAGRFTVYILFQILISFVIGIIIFAIVICTCCIAGCLMAIPYIGTVLVLPVLVFERAYSLYYLAQYGPAYDVFGPEGPDGLPVEAQGSYPPSPGPMVPSQGPEPTVGIEPKTIFVGSDRPQYDLGVNQPMDYNQAVEPQLDKSSGSIEIKPKTSDRDDISRLRPPEPPKPPKPMLPSNPDDPWSQIPPPPPPPYDGQD